MKEIRVKPFVPNPHRRPHKAYLIDEEFAINSDGYYASLIRVKPTDVDGMYAPAELANYIIVAAGSARASALEGVVQKLKAMDAYTLLTRHYDIHNNWFNVNRVIHPRK